MRGKSKALKTQQIQLELPLFATVELVPQNSEMTSIGNLQVFYLRF